MNILIIQENGRHDKNKNFRECFCLKRGFDRIGVKSTVWGLGHENFNSDINFNDFDLIINLENYSSGWDPDLSDINSVKFLWSIDSHVRGEKPFLLEFNKSKYDILLHSTNEFVNEKYKIWFPNAFDDELIYKKNIEKRSDVGFCGNVLNRGKFINELSKRYNFIHDEFVIGDDMVNAINSYRVHWNKNISVDINYRNFETIGCGVFLVTNYNNNYEKIGFKHMENVIFYNNTNEMFEFIDLVIKDGSLREYIGNNGHLLSKKHTYLERCDFLLNLYKDIKT